MKNNKFAIIVAGGKGLRMHSDLPKQFIEIEGTPILMRTLETFRSYDPQLQLVVVLPADQIDFWFELCKKHNFGITHDVVEGGNTRFQSVKNGLNKLPNKGWVAIHDGVRPFVSSGTIENCFQKAMQYGAAIPVIDSVDSLRQTISGGNSVAVDRNLFKMVQTPQVFEIGLLKNAYQQEFHETFTDDASVVEAIGHTVELVAGNRENIKITTDIDLKIARILAVEQSGR